MKSTHVFAALVLGACLACQGSTVSWEDAGRRNQVYPYSYTQESCSEHHVRYYQQIAGLDAAIGDILAQLVELGLAEDTVIVSASDHGLLMGEHGMGGKGLLYDDASKIPCFVHDPRLPVRLRGVTCEELVSSLDVTRTILDYARVVAPECMSGESLRPLSRLSAAESRVPQRA